MKLLMFVVKINKSKYRVLCDYKLGSEIIVMSIRLLFKKKDSMNMFFM
jgi:hypothetical protein